MTNQTVDKGKGSSINNLFYKSSDLAEIELRPNCGRDGGELSRREAAEVPQQQSTSDKI